MPKRNLSPELLEAIRTNRYTEQELDLSEQPLQDGELIELVAALESNRYIKSLSVFKCKIWSRGARILAVSTTLTALDISHNQIGDEGAEALAANTRLTKLNVFLNNISKKGVEMFLGNRTLIALEISLYTEEMGKQLETMLAQNRERMDTTAEREEKNDMLESTALLVSRLRKQFLFQQPVRQRARFLHLHKHSTKRRSSREGEVYAPQEEFSDELLELIRTNQYTEEELNLIGESLSDSSISDLVDALNKNTYIKSLFVPKCGIGPEGARFLAASRTITGLDISYNNIGPEGARFLATSRTIDVLDISCNKIGSDGVGFLAANGTIIALNTSYNKIGPKGAHFLAANRTIIALNMSYNEIGDEGAEILARSLVRSIVPDMSGNEMDFERAEGCYENTTLTALDVSRNQICFAGAKALAATGLTVLNFDGNEVSPDVTDAFLENRSLVKLKIYVPEHGPYKGMREKLDAMLVQNKERRHVEATSDLAMFVSVTRAMEEAKLQETLDSRLSLAGLVRDFAGFSSFARVNGFVNSPHFETLKEEEEKGEEDIDMQKGMAASL